MTPGSVRDVAVPAPAPTKGPEKGSFRAVVLNPSAVVKVATGRAKWAPYRSYTEYRAAQYLGPSAEYEPLRIKVAEGAWYTPDFARRTPVGDLPRWVAYEVKNLRHDCRGSLGTQRRVLKVAAEKLARWGISLRLLILDGETWREEDV
jgi:hypothetical protein